MKYGTVKFYSSIKSRIVYFHFLCYLNTVGHYTVSLCYWLQSFTKEHDSQ